MDFEDENVTQTGETWKQLSDFYSSFPSFHGQEALVSLLEGDRKDAAVRRFPYDSGRLRALSPYWLLEDIFFAQGKTREAAEAHQKMIWNRTHPGL